MADVNSTASSGSNISSTIFTALDVGSGMDSPKLALDLTNAEKLPKQNAINADIIKVSNNDHVTSRDEVDVCFGFIVGLWCDEPLFEWPFE